MDTNSKIMYAFRGWIGFVAFMDLGVAARSFIEKKSFLSKDSVEYNDEEYTTSRILGMFAILKAITLIYTTLYIYCKPVVDLGKWALGVTALLYISECIYFKAAALNVTVLFPVLLNLATLAGLFYIPIKLNIWNYRSYDFANDDENAQLLKQSGNVRRRKNVRKT